MFDKLQKEQSDLSFITPPSLTIPASPQNPDCRMHCAVPAVLPPAGPARPAWLGPAAAHSAGSADLGRFALLDGSELAGVRLAGSADLGVFDPADSEAAGGRLSALA